MSEEKDVWMGTPSQVSNLGSFIFLGLFSWLVLPLLIILWKWLVIKNTKYELTTQRLRTKNGVLNVRTDELELYRVQDYTMVQPFFLRMFSLSNIILETSDKSCPRVVIKAVKNGDELREKIRSAVEECKTKKRMGMVDIQ